jgi:glycolate oxidase iron-sulfur subunit
MSFSPLKNLDYSMLQQCMHCGMCLPTCPTYDATKLERSSPRGRIALMRSIADGHLESSRLFAEEMYFCLGCLACETACPAGVDYTRLFEMARWEVERSAKLSSAQRSFWRWAILQTLFTRPGLLRLVGLLLLFYQKSGLQILFRKLGLFRILPRYWQNLEAQTPACASRFSHELIPPLWKIANPRYTVALLTGCVQDLIFSEVNKDCAFVLAQNGCEVHTPPLQHCCGSLHAHNGDMETARNLARKNIDLFPIESIDAIISNAAGCGSHLKHYDKLLEDDTLYADKARVWSAKVKDIHEWLAQIGFAKPVKSASLKKVCYHEACHLCHGQKISRAPREILESIPDLDLVELPEATWCCGSAGVYNFTQPEMSARLLERKMRHIQSTSAATVATANPGCILQLQHGARQRRWPLEITHPISLLADSYRLSS